jgi:AcrR family transcriptional regulator
MTETNQRILDTAERLFGDQGYAATSLRHIIAEAGVNLAAIHYHYGSKEELLDEVVMRKAGPVNEARLALLDRYEAEAGLGPLAVEVDVKHAHVRQPEQAFGAAHGFAETGGRGDVEAGGQQMAGVQAVADGEMGEAARTFAEGCQLLEAAAEVGAGAGGIFEQHGEAAGMETGGGGAERGDGIRDAFLHGAASTTAGMEHQILRADSGGALQFPTERGDGFGADHGVGGGQVHQVADVDHQGVEVKPPARGREKPDLGRVGQPGAPHARACGEDLEGVGPQLRRMKRGVFERPGGGGVDAQSPCSFPSFFSHARKDNKRGSDSLSLRRFAASLLATMSSM